MFKKYDIHYVIKEPGYENRISFFVRSRKTASGFMHEACVLGIIPGLGYSEDDHKVRLTKVSYSNRTWESWSGQTVLIKLWDKIMKHKGVEKDKMPEKNPFREETEPQFEALWDPEDIFGRFR